jgi:hypothetical protein
VDDVETEEMEVDEKYVQETEDVTTTRSGRQVKKPSRFMAVTKVMHEEWKLEENAKAINAEIKMLFEDLKALRPVKRASIKGGTKILRSHMFVVEKFLATGEFDKMKARLVADGRDQESSMYPDKASPTVAIHSVFTVLGIMSAKKWLKVAKIDVKGAFVQTPMQGEDVYMKIDEKISKYVVELYPKLAEYVEEDGCIYTVMLKAMYGCIQASSLWYKYLKRTLEELGYEMSETDKCVFRKKSGEKIFILLVYVDDILAFVDHQEAEKLRSFLDERFGKVQFEVNVKHSYLGMQISVAETGVVVDMVFYAKKIIEGEEVNVHQSPGNKSMFQVAVDAKELNPEEKKWFHAVTAKLLYLAKRARPDILTAVSFLCTRVQSATVEDAGKLTRVLGYLKGTVERVLYIRAAGEAHVRAYVDAAYALHTDSRSHTGVIIYVGYSLVYVSSKKQKCMSKSPMEAELIGLSDNLGLIELFKELVDFVIGEESKVPIVFQDCKSVISLVTIGGGITRTKHLRARMNLGKEMVDEGRIKVVYIQAEGMKADGLSKPLDPSGHCKFVQLMQN